MTTKKTIKKAPAKKLVAKKVVKKVPSKKAPAKKLVAKKVASKSDIKKKKQLVYANNQTSFWVKNGQILNSLVALRDALDEMEKEVYMYHAGGAHNDFANWVGAVLSDAKCANELEKAKTQNLAKTVVVKHLKQYSL